MPPLLVFLYLTQFPLVPDWPYYEVKLVIIIFREDGYKTNIYDAREVVHQWVRYKKKKKMHIEFLLLLVQDRMSIIFVYYPLSLSKLTQATGELKLGPADVHLHKVRVYPLAG